MFFDTWVAVFKARARRQRFTRIPNTPSDDGDEKTSTFPKQESRRLWSIIAISFASIGIAILSGSVGYFFGRQQTGEVFEEGLLASAGTIPSRMIWNATFSYLAPNRTDDVWMQLYPDGMGLVTHPTLAPDVSAIAVYHQMHCLQVIYQNYQREVVERASHSRRDHPELLNVHTEHCFDYLRQAIFCAADTTLEHVDPELYGEKTALPKKCRNMVKVQDWAERWKTDKLPRDLKNRFAFVRQLERQVYHGRDEIGH